MNKLNNSVDEVAECPLCMEPLEVDDLNFFPCTCGYQICRFCWHRIRTDENELCPACRKEYPENPADFKPLTQEEMIAFKSQKKQRDQQRKQKVTENRKHLANVRVVQKNLVFVVGLPPRLADSDTLKKHEYFGKYGKIHKVVINPSTTYAGVQGPSASAYVTYVHNADALRAIQSVNNITIDGRLIKTSLGTTKYCSHFMKNQQCPKNDCMYLHELGDAEASFTKEEMHQGKHQEYEKRLHDALITCSTGQTLGISNGKFLEMNGGNLRLNNNNGNGNNNIVGTTVTALNSGSSNNNITGSLGSGNNNSGVVGGPSPIITATTTITTGTSHKEAWPSLSVSPVLTNAKETTTITLGNIIQNSTKTRKERSKQEKVKNDKNSRTKQRNNNNNQHSINSTVAQNVKEIERTVSTSRTTCNISEQQLPQQNHNSNANSKRNSTNNNHNIVSNSNENCGETFERDVHEYQTSKNDKQQSTSSKSASVSRQRNEDRSDDEEQKNGKDILSHFRNTINNTHNSMQMIKNNQNDDKNVDTRLIRANSINNDTESSNSETNNKSCAISKEFLSDNSAKNTRKDFVNVNNNRELHNGDSDTEKGHLSSDKQSSGQLKEQIKDDLSNTLSEYESTTTDILVNLAQTVNNKTKSVCSRNNNGDDSSRELDTEQSILAKNSIKTQSSCATTTSTTTAKSTSTKANSACFNTDIFNIDDLTKLNLFDTNSFFSSSSADALQNSSLLKSKIANEVLSIPNSSSNATPHLPDLLNGIDGYQSQTIHANDWENAFKNLLPKSGNQFEDKFQQQLHLQQQQQQQYYQRLQELQKRNLLLSSLGLTHINGQTPDLQSITNTLLMGSNLNSRNTTNLIQHQPHQQPLSSSLQQQQQSLQMPPQSLANVDESSLQNSLFSTTYMSKFFDFHKNQQQKMQNCLNNTVGTNTISMTNGGTSINNLLYDNSNYMPLVDGNRINSQTTDATGQQQQQEEQTLQKKRLLGKIDQMLFQQQQQQSQHSPTANEGKNSFASNPNTDDDLGFDPFIETQKALAELIENEDEVIGNNSNVKSRATTSIGSSKTQQAQQQMQDYMPRIRMPPPGFGPIATEDSNVGMGVGQSMGFGISSSTGTHHISNGGSKILPFINLNSTNYTRATTTPAAATATVSPLPNSNQQHQLTQQQQHQLSNNIWNLHFGLQTPSTPLQQLGSADLQYRQQVSAAANHLGHSQHRNYGGGDWTAMDPAILSFRQFSGFPQQTSALSAHHLQGVLPSATGSGCQGHQSVTSTTSSTTQNQSHQELILQQMAHQQQHLGQRGGYQGIETLSAQVGGSNCPTNALSRQCLNTNVQGMLEYLKLRQFV